MMKKKAVIYCVAKPNICPAMQRDYLDVCFFRLLAYANAHEMQVIAYYEDIQECIGDDLRSGLFQLQFELAKKTCDAILVINLEQLPNCIAYKYSRLVVSIKTTERAAPKKEMLYGLPQEKNENIP